MGTKALVSAKRRAEPEGSANAWAEQLHIEQFGALANVYLETAGE